MSILLEKLFFSQTWETAYRNLLFKKLQDLVCKLRDIFVVNIFKISLLTHLNFHNYQWVFGIGLYFLSKKKINTK